MEFESLVKLIEAVSDSELTGFKYEENGIKLNIQKEKVQVASGGAVVTAPAAAYAGVPSGSTEAVPAGAGRAGSGAAAGNENAAPEEKPGRLVKSPLVGTFYAAPAEDAEAFVTVGASVKKGQIIAIVEAMKLMNDIESDFDGTISEILVENGEAVEYGQPLFRIA